jgi:hypothetical protein
MVGKGIIKLFSQVFFKEFLSIKEIVLQYLQTIDVNHTSISKDAQQEGQFKFIFFFFYILNYFPPHHHHQELHHQLLEDELEL